jgi:hypothetical protein
VRSLPGRETGREGGRRGDTVGGGGSRARGPKSGEENKDDGEVLFGPNPNLLLRVEKTETDRLHRPRPVKKNFLANAFL